MDNTYLMGCCKNKMNFYVQKGVTIRKAFNLRYYCILGGLMRKGARRQCGILAKAMVLSSGGMGSNPCSGVSYFHL